MSQRKLTVFIELTIILLFSVRITFDVQTKLPALVQRDSWSHVPGGTFLPVQSKNPDELGLGKVLVASRDLADPNFAKTVVLVVEYDSKGVVGLIINRRSSLPLSRVFKELNAAKDLSDPVYAGGPVEIPAVFGLLHSQSKLEGAQQIVDGIYLISAKSQFEQILSKRPDPATFHVYLGYAGWTPEQLRQEIRLGAWFIFQGNTQTVFSTNPDSLWRQMIRQTELQMARLSMLQPDT